MTLFHLQIIRKFMFSKKYFTLDKKIDFQNYETQIENAETRFLKEGLGWILHKKACYACTF